MSVIEYPQRNITENLRKISISTKKYKGKHNKNMRSENSMGVLTIFISQYTSDLHTLSLILMRKYEVMEFCKVFQQYNNHER